MKPIFTAKMIRKAATAAISVGLWRNRNPGRFRSAVTGRFVTAQYAYKHPKTTVRERV